MDEQPRIDDLGREAAIVQTFMRLADTLVDNDDVIDFLQYLCERCVALIGIDEAGVLLASPTGNLQAVAASSERTRLLELFEVQNSDGPCLDSFRSGEEVHATDLEQARDRWPMFADQALRYGFGGVQSVPLRLRREVIGALNLLSFRSAPLGSLDAPWPGHWQTSRRSACCRNVRPARPRNRRTGCSERSRAGSGSNKPRGSWPSGPVSGSTKRSSSSAGTPAAIRSASPSSPKASYAESSTSCPASDPVRWRPSTCVTGRADRPAR
jgi:hypothetical protein